jgi:protein gp37
MSLESSGISWTDGTLNSLYGCTACSPGCQHCYAVRRVYRHSCNPMLNADRRFDGLVTINSKGEKCFFGEMLFDPQHLYTVLGERRPKRIFVNEFSDLLHASLPLSLILEHIKVFNAASWHQFQILTKRSSRLAELNEMLLAELGGWPANVWMGVSVCSSAKVEMQRIDQLGATSARLKWVSFEPWVSDLRVGLRQSVPNLRTVLLRNKICWTVIGGESGKREDTRLMTLDDARYLIEESRAAGARVHFKQLGTALAVQLGVYSTRGKGEHRAKGGNPDQWPVDLNIREWPEFVPSTTKHATDFRPNPSFSQVMHFHGKH